MHSNIQYFEACCINPRIISKSRASHFMCK